MEEELNVHALKNKDAYWQYIRGLCIICVIIIHCKTGVGYGNNIESSWSFDYWFILRQFINFPVAIFIFLAGYFTNIKSVKKCVTYITNRGGRLLLSFLMWSTFYTLINILVSNSNVNIIKTLVKLALGLSSGPLYFIVVLLQLTVLSPLLVRALQTKSGTRCLFLVTPIYLLFLYSYVLIHETQMPFYQTLFPGWFIFFYSGLWIKIRGYKPTFNRNLLVSSILCCSVGVLLSIIEGYWLLAMGFPVSLACSQIKISSFLYAFAIANLLMVVKPRIHIKGQMPWLKRIGDNSFGIYYIHMLWIMVSNNLLSHFSLLNNVLPLYQLVQLIFTLTFSCLSISITKKIIGEKISRRLLGF